MTELQNLFLIEVVLAAVAVPLIRGWIPPNRLYGFRTEEALSTPDIWYPANRALGWSLLVAAVAALAFGLTLLAVFPEWPAERMATWMKGGLACAILLGVVASIRYYVKRL